MAKKMIVIGAGPGGLAAAMLLAGKGYDVEVYEKQTYVGGRNGAVTMDGYTFDIGPTFLSMPEIAEELFEAAGRNLHDYVDLQELSMMYELIFKDKRVQMFKDPELLSEEIERHYPGNAEGYTRFMNATRKKMERLKPILQSPMDRYYQYISWKVLRALPQLSLGKSLYSVLSDYFTDHELRLAFTFQSKYLGMSPWECPGAFSILSFMEHEYGIFHPIGGVNQLSKAMAKVVTEHGGSIHLGRGVKKLWIEDRNVVKGIITEDGEQVSADEVIINGDFAHVMSNLVEDGVLKKYSKEKLKKKKYSCSTFMIYLGIDKQFDLPHHSILFAEDYKKNVEEITETFTLPEDPSIYIQNASVTDKTLAPPGHSTLYILAPVPNNVSGIDWTENEQMFRNLVLDAVESKTNLKNIREHIQVEKIISPHHWEVDFNIYQGATFNLGHQLTQMMALRPHNKFEELENCWLVGGGTHPGSGLPTILESARITTKMLLNEDPSYSFTKDQTMGEAL
ncbi:NAD(P)/FAD-dependent oxidoreductase [Rossellomorea aquimaris]|uniref:Phytoene desaturase n=1 Tax=Rossellomorea aquimaris TaxID=189382 RepID=A0A5D4TYT4_9BACI|nr:phytoene desaturase family protein [Rossellomorea aquimaris]TYS80179.1 phytoene desaturase [Rossellomorea aquimaris]TYS85562.1 phytoene desaturase [Rossellomorea aquimaris]